MPRARILLVGGILTMSVLGFTTASPAADANTGDGDAAPASKWKGPDDTFFSAARADMEKATVPLARMAALAAICDEQKTSEDLLERAYDKAYAIISKKLDEIPLLQALTVDADKLSGDFGQWLVGFEAGYADSAAGPLKPMTADQKAGFCKKADAAAQEALKEK